MNNNKRNVAFAPKAAPARPLTEEEKKIKVAQFLAQKRENFAINILCNLIQGTASKMELSTAIGKAIVGLSVEMADELMDKLYPMEEPEVNKE